MSAVFTVNSACVYHSSLNVTQSPPASRLLQYLPIGLNGCFSSTSHIIDRHSVKYVMKRKQCKVEFILKASIRLTFVPEDK